MSAKLLLGDLEGAKISYKRVRELETPTPVASVVAVLRRLQKALESDPRTSEALKQGIEWMQSDARP